MDDAIRPSEYGRHGIVGIGVPQANPTVEQEAFALRPPGLSLVVARLTSCAADPEKRILEYLQRTIDYVAQFDDLEIDAFGVACTGSSYLLGADQEQELLEALSRKLGYPVITAATAITDSLRLAGATRISLVSPYPEWLLDKAVAFWEAKGFAVSELRTVPLSGSNLHAIYKLSSAAALAHAQELDFSQTDAVVFTGTGMPTLGAIRPLAELSAKSVFSSNLCLMSSLARLTHASSAATLTVPNEQITADL